VSIRDRGYKPYEGTFTPMAQRWAVVMRHSLRMTFKQPWVIAILIISVFPALIGGVLMYIAAKMWAQVPPELAAQQGINDPGQYVFFFLVKWYGAPVQAFLMAMFAGGGAIADDARQGAFQFYFARPISREQYLAGKVVPVVLTVAIVSLVPSLLLAIVRLAVARDGSDVAHQLLLIGQAVGLGGIEAVAMGVPVVALSSISKGRGYAQGAFAALFLLPYFVGGIFSAITRNPWPAILSVPAQLEAIGSKIFSIPLAPEDRPLPFLAAVLVMAVTLIGSVALLRARLKAAEVVAG
jgi:ABC-type transport system involved in multi-copper enzyme maturation permease subunit